MAAPLTAEFILAIDTRPLYPFRTDDQRSIQAEPNVKPPTLDTGKPIVQDYPRGTHTPVSDRLEGAAFLTHQKQLDGQSSTTRHKRKRSEGQLPHTLLNAKARRGRTSSVSDTDSSSTCHPAPIRSGASWTTSSSSDPGYTASLYPEAIRATQSASSGFALSLPGPPSLRDSSARLLAPVGSSNKQEEASSSDSLYSSSSERTCRKTCPSLTCCSWRKSVESTRDYTVSPGWKSLKIPRNHRILRRGRP